MCYQYWPGNRAQSYGEFRIELLSEEKKSGFLLRNFSVQQAKVSTQLQRSLLHLRCMNLCSLPQPTRCGSSTSQSGAQTTSGVEMVMLWSLSLRKCPRFRGRLRTTPLSSMDCESVSCSVRSQLSNGIYLLSNAREVCEKEVSTSV